MDPARRRSRRRKAIDPMKMAEDRTAPASEVAVVGVLEEPQPHRWRTVILLAVLAGVSCIDKFITSIIAPGLSSALSLSDTQVGFLIGPAFAILFALSGIPLAYLIDTRNRKRLVLFGVILWSSMTVLSAFAS